MNGWLGDDPKDSRYLDQKNTLTDKAIELIKMELPLMEKAQEAFYQNAKVGIGIDALQKIADALKSSTTPYEKFPVFGTA